MVMFCWFIDHFFYVHFCVSKMLAHQCYHPSRVENKIERQKTGAFLTFLSAKGTYGNLAIRGENLDFVDIEGKLIQS
uniref:Uncharacterized protein n=1 Tax=Nelumbo nucifera TaxID=4432 RepID=A0A822ZLK3_NELNU|nr:TPA_asm: hypothetical protein HUJ06_004007 [Nelumbo nucifera]